MRTQQSYQVTAIQSYHQYGDVTPAILACS